MLTNGQPYKYLSYSNAYVIVHVVVTLFRAVLILAYRGRLEPTRSMREKLQNKFCNLPHFNIQVGYDSSIMHAHIPEQETKVHSYL